ncbi:uncharacterized protein LOC129601774 [Paramacrobiotus metropolitanus]|uniref:uncharacterized protein LOC129601774 n=1 Tax=Paramacrobiotus metropolitanus TaxID=2943436 RepID=UPI00244645AB|nr:uncharacterized protein LOC129601774 [Paramacrobiotus metropolitanus]
MEESERKKRVLIFLTFLASCIGIALLSTALATDYWIVSRLKDINSNSTGATAGDNETYRFAKQILTKNRPGGWINFGLFRGFVRYNKGLGDRQAELKTVCDVSCYHLMIVDPEHSIALPAASTQQPAQHLLSNVSALDLSDADLPYGELCMSEPEGPTRIFQNVHLFNFGLWAATIFFVCLGIFFGVVAAVYGLLNTTYTPISVINGIFGMYIWNGIGVFCSDKFLLSMLIWVILFYTHFQYNVLPAELLYPRPKFSTCGSAELGFSFWLCLVAMLLFAFNIILLTLKDIELRRPSVKHVVPSNDNMFMY